MARWGLLALVIVLLGGCNLSTVPPTQQTALTPQRLACAQIVSQAVQTVGAVCSELSRDTVCYGNRLVQAAFQPGSAPQFSVSGDRIELLAVQRLETSPLDETAQTWGIALLKALVNIPDTLPGQGVTFLLYGDTALDGISPPMNAVRLRTGIGPLPCAEAPPSAMLLQSPQGTSVTINLNGASLTLGSTLHLTATPNGLLTIATIEGSAIVSAFNTTRVVLPGAQVTLPLGATDGLQVIGPPSEPQPFDAAAIQRAPLSLLERPVNIPAPIARVTSTPLPTATIARPIIPSQPTALPCVPRPDWTATYTIQRGDTLFSIAQRFRVTLAELQQANCILNPNVILPGQVIRVPFVLQPTAPTVVVPTLPRATFTPTPTWTPLPTEPAKRVPPTNPPKATDVPGSTIP
ncbi:MAG: LysM peptidoglycan-binding domain-containing protein [Chloroflexi bacterium]|nr:LysM peptidoglycan-binding domain-containing protein [Chloroflexota bacterium]